MIPALYKGSVKDVLGPVEAAGHESVVFRYTDAFSVFDWGRMPDSLEGKGTALTILAAELMERLQRPEEWKEFSKTPEANALRKAVPPGVGTSFNEIGEKLKMEGLATHYLGVLEEKDIGGLETVQKVEPRKISSLTKPSRYLVGRRVQVITPHDVRLLGRPVADYRAVAAAPGPKLVPLEVVFRFSCPAGSSYRERSGGDDGPWDFPVLEMFTKLESVDRLVPWSEALAISGLGASRLQEILLRTAWVAAFLRSLASQAGLELADGKLEWGQGADGEVFLVDAIGPDELRLSRGGVSLSKEFLREFYRSTDWYGAMKRAKASGVPDWKLKTGMDPPRLPPDEKVLATQIYLSLTNVLTGKRWFPHAWDIGKIIEALRRVEKFG